MREGVVGASKVATRRVAALVGAAVVAVTGLTTVGVGGAQAIPEYSNPNFVTSLRCDSANPWPLGPLRIHVDVFSGIRFPSDGLPPPAIELIGTDRSKAGLVEYSMDVTVSWRNLATGRTGVVSAPSRARNISWQIDIHPGAGPVSFVIRQKIGAIAFLPMVNPQFSTCRGTATAF